MFRQGQDFHFEIRDKRVPDNESQLYKYCKELGVRILSVNTVNGDGYM